MLGDCIGSVEDHSDCCLAITDFFHLLVAHKLFRHGIKGWAVLWSRPSAASCGEDGLDLVFEPQIGSRISTAALLFMDKNQGRKATEKGQHFAPELKYGFRAD